MSNSNSNNAIAFSDCPTEPDHSIEIDVVDDPLRTPHGDYAFAAFANIMDKVVFDTGQNEVEVMTKHLESHFFLLKFDFKSFGNIGSAEKRIRKYAAIGEYIEMVVSKVMQKLFENGGELIHEDRPEDESETSVDFTPYGISFVTSKGQKFDKNIPIDRADFDAALLIHPDFLPYFEEYLARYNRSESGLLFDFVEKSPIRWLKMVRYNRSQGELVDLIFEKVANMTDADIQPLLETDAYPLQEFPHREHIWIDFYEWQATGADEGEFEEELDKVEDGSANSGCTVH